MTFEEFIMKARDLGASDIHLTVGAPTVIRVHGELRKFKEFENLSDQVVNRIITKLLSPEQERLLNEGHDIDFSFEIKVDKDRIHRNTDVPNIPDIPGMNPDAEVKEEKAVIRQRANVFTHGGKLACSIRLLNDHIPDIAELGLPDVIIDLAKKRRGLILVTGPTGAGKSTSLASMIQYINKTRPCHIITVEDPIEYRYEQARATIHQREIGIDIPSFEYALRSALREDPDVILIGEMRDYETISLAMTAAETGHLVLGTLHTSSAAQTIDRIIDVCPPDAKEQVRMQLANMLQGILAQLLIPTADGKGRVAAVEVMIGTDAVKNLIRSNKIAQMDTAMQGGASYGMQTLNGALGKLYKAGKISYQTALEYANNPDELEKKLLEGSL